MATFYPSFLDDNPEHASLHSVADHIQYIGDLIGYRHVGIGSDFDGMAVGPKGLEDVTEYPYLIREVQKRGVRRKDILGIMGLKCSEGFGKGGAHFRVYENSTSFRG